MNETCRGTPHHRSFENSQLHLLDQASHCPQWDRPEIVADLIRSAPAPRPLRPRANANTRTPKAAIMREGRGIGTRTNPETSYTATWANGPERSSSSVEPTEPASIVFATSGSHGSISKTGNEYAR